MKSYSANEVRNVVVLGHGGAGKTSIVEAALYVCQITKRLGTIDNKNTVSDYDQEEMNRKFSINASMIPIEWLNTKINFIDTPGYYDFLGEVRQPLAIADLALIVINAKSGVEGGAKKAWEYATEANIPKFIFINGMDDENNDIDKIVADMKSIFGKSIAPLQIPFKENGKFSGFVNAIKKEGRKFVNGRTENCDVPNGMENAVNAMHDLILESVAETSDELMEKYFQGEEFTPAEIQNGIRVGLLDGTVTPVLIGSATMNAGIRVLMNTIVDYLPTSKQIHPYTIGTNVKTNEQIEIPVDENTNFSAFVFKTIADPYVGQLSLFKVCSGKLNKNTQLYNPRTEQIEKFSHLLVLRGKEQIEVSELLAGDIGAILKLQSVQTGDTLCDKNNPVVYPQINFGQSLTSMAVFAKTKGDEDKIAQAFARLMEEDKTLHMTVNPETHETIISCVGEIQLDVIVSKLKTKYKVDVELKTPTVAYRERIKGKVKVQGKYKKQSGGHGQYGDVHIEFEPSNTVDPYIFEEKIFGGSVPRQYFPAVEKGLQESVKSGPLAGYPVVGIKATLVDGSYHPVDSSEMAFKMATIQAFKEAFMQAKPTLMEPIVHVSITVPNEYTGDIISDMNKRRGKILGMEKANNKQVIMAEVPHSEMFKYPTELRALSHGMGTFTLKHDRYEDTTSDVQKKVVEANLHKAKENN